MENLCEDLWRAYGIIAHGQEYPSANERIADSLSYMYHSLAVLNKRSVNLPTIATLEGRIKNAPKSAKKAG